jgi:hypothetical protein
MSSHSYLAAVKALDAKILADEDLGYYQGDHVALIGNDYYADDKVGFLSIGYGSCSGCDEWEAAETIAERAEIVTRIISNIKWFEGVDAAKAYVLSPDTELQWYAHDDSWASFVKKVEAL